MSPGAHGWPPRSTRPYVPRGRTWATGEPCRLFVRVIAGSVGSWSKRANGSAPLDGKKTGRASASSTDDPFMGAGPSRGRRTHGSRTHSGGRRQWRCAHHLMPSRPRSARPRPAAYANDGPVPTPAGPRGCGGAANKPHPTPPGAHTEGDIRPPNPSTPTVRGRAVRPPTPSTPTVNGDAGHLVAHKTMTLS